MNYPKWFSTDHDRKICDAVLSLKQDRVLRSSHEYGMVNGTVLSQDGIIRKVRYRNNHENVDRYTTRWKHDLVLIHPIDELNLMAELGKVASIANKEYEEMNI